jgi:23S rRNA (cytidine1920-2'-O)/16S rRNA (cytidine1409-2'-O)-methyltransferase
MKKKRLDELVVEQGLAESIDKARRLIMAGEIRSGDRVWEKSGEKIPITTELNLKGQVCKWVSRGGLKLEHALLSFSIDPADRRCLDIGSSTGGFTHVLLESGAREIVAVDVGYGLLAQRVRNDSRVTVKERTNFRRLEPGDLGENFDLIVTDVSFISLRLILPKAEQMLKDTGAIIALIKPQFEAPHGMVPEGGIITDKEAHIQIINDLGDYFTEETSLGLVEMAPVPLVSRRKNIEFVSLWRKKAPSLSRSSIKDIILKAHER